MNKGAAFIFRVLEAMFVVGLDGSLVIAIVAFTGDVAEFSKKD